MLLVDDEVAHLEVAEVGKEAAGGAAPAPGMEVDLLGEDVAVGQHAQADGRQLEPGGQGEDADLDRRRLAQSEAFFAQDVPQALRAARVPEKEHRAAGGRLQVRGQPAHVARVARDRACREIQGPTLGMEVVEDEGRARVDAGGRCLRCYEGFPGRQ